MAYMDDMDKKADKLNLSLSSHSTYEIFHIAIVF